MVFRRSTVFSGKIKSYRSLLRRFPSSSKHPCASPSSPPSQPRPPFPDHRSDHKTDHRSDPERRIMSPDISSKNLYRSIFHARVRNTRSDKYPRSSFPGKILTPYLTTKSMHRSLFMLFFSLISLIFTYSPKK